VNTPLHIGIAGQIATEDVAPLLDAPVPAWPRGYEGAPLLGTLITELLERGHRVSAFTLSRDMPLRDDGAVTLRGCGGRFALHLVPLRPRAWPFNGRRPGRIVDLYAFERRGLERAIQRAKPDVVHAHWAYEFAWATLRTGLPHVVTCHDSPLVIARFQRDFRHGGYRWLRAAMAWHVLRRAGRVTTVSPYMVEQVQPLCRAQVSVVPNPITERAFAPPPPRGEGPLRIVMAANGWDVRKNTGAGLQAFALLSQRLPQVELRVFGQDHGEQGKAQAWWEASGGQGQVRFVGSVSHEQLLQEMAQAQVFLHPALEESFGAVLAEAMAAGVPIVAGAASGAVPWVVQGAGRLVDVRRPEAIADALHELLTDRDMASSLGLRGRQRVRDTFSAAAVADAYEAEYAAARSMAQRGGDAL
jgi:glycosyltransferase involved in cell wall biosynthesis